MPEGSYLPVHGATLYYTLLVLVPVSNGTTLFYESLAPHLASHFRVLLYDCRSYHRSRADTRPTKDELYTTHAGDVAALIKHISPDKPEAAFAFTSSASTGIATEVLLRYPHLVHAIVLHEPTLTPVIPGETGEQIKQDGYDIAAKAHQRDLRGANAIINSFLYTDAELRLFRSCPVFARVPSVFKPADMVYYLATEIPGTRDYLPDLERLKQEAGRGKGRVVLGRGPAGVG